MYFLDLLDDRDRGVQAGLGRDRRLDRRGRRRRHLELPRPHQRHRRRDRGRARSRGSPQADPGDRPVRRGRRGARPPRGDAGWRPRRRPGPEPACPRSPRRSSRCAAATGLAELFANLGVQGIVTGGQTLNPSTAELLDTVEHVNADQVVILPNNKNIIPVAEQVDALTSKTVVVVPTRTMPEALAALVVYDPEAGAERERRRDGRGDRVGRDRRDHAGGARLATARSARSPPATGWASSTVTASCRRSPTRCSRRRRKLLEHPARRRRRTAHDHHRRRCRRGDDHRRSRAWLADEHADVQVEVHPGGQPLYPYLFGVE